MNGIIDLPNDLESFEHWRDTINFIFRLFEKVEGKGIESIRRKLSPKNRGVDFEKSYSIFSESENRILFEMLNLLCAEKNAVLISRVIEKRIELACLRENEKVALYLMLEGIFCIQNHLPQVEIKKKFCAMLDENFMEAMKMLIFEEGAEFMQNSLQFQGSAFRSFTFKDSYLLSNSAIKKVLEEIDPTDLSKALKLSDIRVKEKFFFNMDKTTVELLLEDIEKLPATKAEIRIKQHHIENMLVYLQRQGRIYIPLVCIADELGALLST